jgi:hypothetical protein
VKAVTMLKTLAVLTAFAGQISGSPTVQSQQHPALETRQGVVVGIFNFEEAIKIFNGRQDDVILALEDIDLLADAVKNIQLDDPAFIDLFGKGWDESNTFKRFWPNIVGNFAKAIALTQDGNPLEQVSVKFQVLENTCKDERFVLHIHKDTDDKEVGILTLLWLGLRLLQLTGVAKTSSSAHTHSTIPMVPILSILAIHLIKAKPSWQRVGLARNTLSFMSSCTLIRLGTICSRRTRHHGIVVSLPKLS